MRIAIVGAGALGLYYGALLQRSGQDVHFLLRSDYEAIRTGGLTVTSPDGDFRLPTLQCYRSPEEIGPVDLVLIGLKTFANHQLAALTAPLLGPATTLLTLQNGLGNEELLAAAFGPERVVGGVAFLCANRGVPGTVHHLGVGMIRLGEWQGGITPRTRQLADLFTAAGVKCDAVADLLKARWEKLVWNIPFNGLAALTGKTTDRLLAHPPTRAAVVTLMNEVVAAAAVQNLSTPIEGSAFIPRMLSMTEGMGAYRPSMMIDRLEGRPLELDAIYAIPLARAAAQNMAMPAVAQLHALLALGETDPR